MTDLIIFDDIDKNGPQTYRGSFELGASEIDRDEVMDGGAVVIDVRADKGDTAGEYILTGSSRFTADLSCSRCVEPFPFANSSSFNVRFRPRPEASTQENEEVEINDPEELEVEFYSDREIALKDFALEQVQLAIPMKPLCDEKCLGLCAVCGTNRSREACKCETSIVDDRWNALRGLRDQLKKKDV